MLFWEFCLGDITKAHHAKNPSKCHSVWIPTLLLLLKTLENFTRVEIGHPTSLGLEMQQKQEMCHHKHFHHSPGLQVGNLVYSFNTSAHPDSALNLSLDGTLLLQPSLMQLMPSTGSNIVYSTQTNTCHKLSIFDVTVETLNWWQNVLFWGCCLEKITKSTFPPSYFPITKEPHSHFADVDFPNMAVSVLHLCAR